MCEWGEGLIHHRLGMAVVDEAAEDAWRPRYGLHLVQRQLELRGVLPHDRMLPECGGKIMGKSVRAGSGKNEPPGLSRPPLLDTPLECSKLPG